MQKFYKNKIEILKSKNQELKEKSDIFEMRYENVKINSTPGKE